MQKEVKNKLTLRGILMFLIVLTIIRAFFQGHYEHIFVGVLTIILFNIPIFIDKRLHIDIPPLLEGIIYLFIYSSEILGEINSYYTKIPHFDTILHTINGFLMAAIGIALIDILNRSDKFAFNLSPIFVSFVSFCFSMTIGVLWEFFEFSMDMLFAQDMQKDYIIHQINSVTLNPDKLTVVERVPIESLIVNGEDWIAKYGGYIDIGIIDTMKDLIVNFIGAVVFSIIGYFYIKNRGKNEIIDGLIPKLHKEETQD